MNPKINIGVPGTVGLMFDDHGHGGFTAPYTNGSFSGIQCYVYHCDVCMGVGDYETLMGPHSIDRFVEPFISSNGYWQYRITKSNATAIFRPL